MYFVARCRSATYVSASLECKGLLHIRPDVAIAGEVRPQMIQWLPCEHHSSIGRPIEKGPVHRLQFANDLGRGYEIFHNRFRRQHVHRRISIARHQVHVRQLQDLSQIGVTQRSGSIGKRINVPAALAHGLPGHPSCLPLSDFPRITFKCERKDRLDQSRMNE